MKRGEREKGRERGGLKFPCNMQTISNSTCLPNNMRTVTAIDITHAVLAAESLNLSRSSR